MKNLILSFISVLILMHTATGQKHDMVVDIEGDELVTDQSYYVQPIFAVPGREGGIKPYETSNVTCSYGVQSLSFGDGIPVNFSFVNSFNVRHVIREQTDLDISFSDPVHCGPSNLWKRGDYDDATEQYFVEIGRVPHGKPEILTIDDAFQIRKAFNGQGGYYKFAYCPPSCVRCSRKCLDVGLFSDDGVIRLVASDKVPFYIRFRKYEPEIARY